MSNLSEFIGGGIKSVQTLTVSGTANIDVTINAIDPNKAFIMLSRSSCSSSTNVGSRGAVILNATTVRTTIYTVATATTIDLTVVEYY